VPGARRLRFLHADVLRVAGEVVTLFLGDLYEVSAGSPASFFALFAFGFLPEIELRQRTFWWPLASSTRRPWRCRLGIAGLACIVVLGFNACLLRREFLLVSVDGRMRDTEDGAARKCGENGVSCRVSSSILCVIRVSRVTAVWPPGPQHGARAPLVHAPARAIVMYCSPTPAVAERGHAGSGQACMTETRTSQAEPSSSSWSWFRRRLRDHVAVLRARSSGPPYSHPVMPLCRRLLRSRTGGVRRRAGDRKRSSF